MKNNLTSKLLRQFTAFLPVAKNRRGECRGCGACCKLPYRCPMLRDKEDGTTYCAIYPIRPHSCRAYPRTAKEHQTADVCGYYFVDETETTSS